MVGHFIIYENGDTWVYGGSSYSSGLGINNNTASTWKMLAGTTYTVTLNANGGSIISGNITKYIPSEGAQLPTNVIKTGYTFDGWYENNSFSGNKVTNIPKQSIGNKTYYAKWIANTCTVNLYTNGGTINGESVTSYTPGTAKTLPTNVTKTGYNFAGWYESSSFTGSRVTSIPSSATGDKTYYAKWTAATYTVTLNKNGGTVNSGDVTSYTYGAAKTLPTNITKTGYTFDGWYENSSFSGNRVTSIPSSATGNKTYYAKWTAATYTVTLNKNGGTVNSGDVTSYTYGAAKTLPTNITKTGYTFDGWYENSSFSGNRVTSIPSSATGNKTYYAKWTANTYTVTLNTNGGNVNSGDVTSYTYGTSKDLPTNVTKQGYNFAGWYENNSFTGDRVTTISNTTTGNKTYYAKWTNNTYTVTLNKNGGNINFGDINEYTYGTGATLPTNVTKEGYVFRGWFENQNCEGTAITTITTTDTGNKTYYAKWLVDTDRDGIPDIEDDDTQVPYKVEHYIQNTDLRTYTLKETVDKVEGTQNKLTGNLGHEVTAVPRNYTGFRENQTATGRVPSGIVVVDGSLTLKLYYDREIYNVTLNTNVGGVTGAQIAEGKEVTSYAYGVGANLPTLTEVTKPYYVFRGWFENENCEGTAVTRITETDTGNRTYYAKWLVDTDGDGIPDIEDDDTQVPYKIEHYKQKLDKTGYDLAETQTTIVVTNEETGAQETKILTGNLGHEVTAVPRNYTGFTENQTVTGRVPSGIVVIDGSLTLKLYYDRNSYKLPLDVDGEKEEIDYVYGEEVPLPTNKEKPGYTFEGWYDNEEQAGEKVEKVDTNEIDPENPPTYYIKWTANTNTPYKVEHYLRTLDNEVIGYELIETQNLTGTTDTKATAQPKEYRGCTENTQYEERKPEGNIAGNGSLVLKLYYERNKYQINYELNGGTTRSPLNKSYTYGEEVILSNRIEKEGYIFGGWYENSECTGQAVTSIKETDVGDKTYYAKWVKEEDAPFTITSNKYKIEDETKYITKVSPNTNKETFMKNITTNGNMKVLNKQGSEIQNNDLVGTGYTLQVEYKGTIYEYIIGVRGDLDGNGQITATDLSTLNQKLTNKIKLTGILEKSADIDFDGQITVTDLSTLNQALIKKVTL